MDVVLNEACFGDCLELIHKLTGITIATNRNSMVEGRLRRRVRALNLSSYEEYLKLVREDRGEQARFIDLLTTNETYFYRTPRIWAYIEKLLPVWMATHPNTVFTAWSAAASSGEEAYTLAILCQAFRDQAPGFRYQITGTDVSEERVALCQRGLYSGRSIDSFRKARPELFGRYMREVEDGAYEVLPDIRSRLRFQQHNLFRSLALSDRFDLVLIRNVLIYFQPRDQERVVALVQPRMTEDGIMIVGESESLTHLNTHFKAVEPLVYRQNRSVAT